MAGPPGRKPIAQGMTAEVYAWDETRVLKLFREGWPADRVAYEAAIARVVHAGGWPVPAVGDLVEVDGRRGLLYERVEGSSMMDCIARRPWTFSRYTRLWAELHAGLHAGRTVPELPSQRTELANRIQTAQVLPPDLRQAALRALDAMPDGDRLCHGDLWPGNVLMSPRGPIVIDWICATRGNPLADVARSSVLVLGGARLAALLVGAQGDRPSRPCGLPATVFSAAAGRSGAVQGVAAHRGGRAAERERPRRATWLLATAAAGLSRYR